MESSQVVKDKNDHCRCEKDEEWFGEDLVWGLISEKKGGFERLHV